MDTPNVYYKKIIDEIDDFWKGFSGDVYFLDKEDTIEELKNKKKYISPQDLWKSTLPEAKKTARKINRHRVYLNETQGFPPNVADQISRLSVGFGKRNTKSSLNINKIKNVKNHIKYLNTI